MLADGLFTDHGAPPEPLLGMEVELNLVDDEMNPAMANAEVLDAIADPDYQTELGQFNIEINVSPRPFVDNDTMSLEQRLRTSLNRAEQQATRVGTHLVMIGTLPTCGPSTSHINGSRRIRVTTC